MTQNYLIPDRPINAKSEPPPPSTINKNLQSFLEKEPNVGKVMDNGPLTKDKKQTDEKPNRKDSPSILNSITGGKLVWRD